MKQLVKLLGIFLVAGLLFGCKESKTAQLDTSPQALHSGEECHVCGMIIAEWPGPKGQALNLHKEEVFNFCSTADLFAWWLQPENKSLQAKIYVHDMEVAPWSSPEKEHLIDAREAWYVIGSNKMGSMGPTLVSFASQAVAEKFAAKEGGKLVGFNDINSEVLREISLQGHQMNQHINDAIHENLH